jgi:signal transduction histidine kinase
MDLVRSKITTQVERAHFTLNLHCPAEAAGLVVEVDVDYFTQILINLVDNALKFSAKAEKRAVDIGYRSVDGQGVTFTVRDYGPGIAKGQMQKIFELFYRSENELTRETVGTGIGLALVRQLAAAMNGRVDVLNVDPGAEFGVRFPQCRRM